MNGAKSVILSIITDKTPRQEAVVDASWSTQSGHRGYSDWDMHILRLDQGRILQSSIKDVWEQK